MEAFRVFLEHDQPIRCFVGIRNLRLVASLTLGLCLANVAQSAPLAIDSIEVSPTPLATGQPFTLAITTSPDVTQATATVDFHPGKPQSLEIPLVKQGLLWTGFGVVPGNIDHQLPSDTGAKVKVSVFDGKHHAEAVAHFPLNVNGTAISALFAGGILTVTGDDHDNNITVGRDVAGTLLVNGGAVPVIGGVPTVATTSLIRILGLKGNDVLLVDDLNGPMPPANLLGGEGDDTLTGSANADELDGGPGNDTLIGGDGDDVLMGGPGNDILIGGRGADQMIGGEDDDQFVWNPGDGSDLVEGQDGQDTLLFIGANINEAVDISANGQRLRFFRNIANITMDCDGIEQVVFRALGGADRVTINDMSGTQVTNVVVDLSGSTPGAGDGSADTVVVNGTGTNDVITLKGSAAEVNVLGLAASVTVLNGEQDLDELLVNTLAGVDSVDASAVQAGAIDLTLNGGDGDDFLIGGQGNDLLIGGRGNDTMFGGPGDDTFTWNPGDGSDVIEGQAGEDSMVFNGANINEKVDISANGRRLRFFRDVANITMDCDGVELVEFRALGGADTITVNDLSGTDVTRVNLDLAGVAASGVGDNSADTVIVNGTAGNDGVGITGTPASGVNVAGLAATVNIVGSEPAFDQLIVRLLAGDDVAEASGLQAGVIGLTLDGGPGNDVLVGSAGADVLLGGPDDDVLEGGPGQDVLDGGPGNNTLIQ